MEKRSVFSIFFMTLTVTTPQKPNRNTARSLVLFALSVLSVIGAIGLGFASLPFFTQTVEFGIFWFIAEVGLGLGTLLFVTLPSSKLLQRTGNSRFRTSLRLSKLTLILIGFEMGTVVLFSH